jgi:GNAT superfamily N-acetyltransferase
MDIRRIEGVEGIEASAALAAAEHARLRAALPFMPARDAAAYAPRIGWMTREGRVLGLFDGARLEAFLGGFIIDDFRNAGAGAYCPDWCHGVSSAQSAGAFDAYRALYRELAPLWIEAGARLHAASAYASDAAALDALSLTGFGRIVMDAARPTGELASDLAARASAAAPRGATRNATRGAPAGASLRDALPSDAAALAALDAVLASHIAASPVLMPRTHGRSEEEWSEWLGGESAVAILAESDGKAVGFIKAEDPQFDVTHAVHDERVLAIDGMLVVPELRGRALGRALLAALVGHAQAAGKSLMSVDCETLNPEAYAFWTAWFRPVAWSFERRV